MSDRIDRLSKLAALREQGVLTPEEFEAERAAILAEQEPGAGEVDSFDDPRWADVFFECRANSLTSKFQLTGTLRASKAGLEFEPKKKLSLGLAEAIDHWRVPWPIIQGVERVPVTWRDFGPMKNKRLLIRAAEDTAEVLAVFCDIPAFLAAIAPFLPTADADAA